MSDGEGCPRALLTELGSTLDRARQLFESLAQNPAGIAGAQDVADRVQELERSIQDGERDREELDHPAWSRRSINSAG